MAVDPGRSPGGVDHAHLSWMLLLGMIVIAGQLGCGSRPDGLIVATGKGPIESPGQRVFQAVEPRAFTAREVVYVPIYSHVLYESGRVLNVTATLSIRNTDRSRPLVVMDVDYHGSDGKLLRHELTEPRTLDPLASLHFVVPESDVDGGIGASFLVEWAATAPLTQPLSPPIIEAVMIGVRGNQGISFLSGGRTIERRNAESAAIPFLNDEATRLAP